MYLNIAIFHDYTTCSFVQSMLEGKFCMLDFVQQFMTPKHFLFRIPSQVHEQWKKNLAVWLHIGGLYTPQLCQDYNDKPL